MIQVKNYLLYCCGMSWLDSKRYGNDLALDRRETNLLIESGIDQMVRARQNTDARQTQRVAFAQAGWLQQPALQPFIQIAQSIQQLIPQPIQTTLANLVAAARNYTAPLANAMAQTRTVAENILTRVVNFFFGKKTEKTTEEKKLREDDDFGNTDLFDKRIVEASMGASSGGGGRR